VFTQVTPTSFRLITATRFPAHFLGGYPTVAAHTLVRIARTRSSQHALAVAIASAYFLEGSNIADPEILGEIASNYGFTHDEAVTRTAALFFIA